MNRDRKLTSDVEHMVQNARTFYKVRDVELMVQNARTFYKVRDVELIVQNARTFYKVIDVGTHGTECQNFKQGMGKFQKKMFEVKLADLIKLGDKAVRM